MITAERLLTQHDGLAELLRYTRSRARLSGQELAKRNGWQASKVSRMERGKQLPSTTDIDAWSNACDCNNATRTELHRRLTETNDALTTARIDGFDDTPFTSAINKLRSDAGGPSARWIAHHTNNQISHTTIAGILAGTKTPQWSTASVLISTLGGNPDHFQDAWTTEFGALPQPEHPAKHTNNEQLIRTLDTLIEEIRQSREDFKHYLQHLIDMHEKTSRTNTTLAGQPRKRSSPGAVHPEEG